MIVGAGQRAEFFASEFVPLLGGSQADFFQGFEVVGLAADEVEKVREFLDEVPVDFPIVYGDMFDVMDISTEYGNSFGGLPFSAFIDRDGNVRYTQKPGEVTFEEAEEILKRLL